MAVLIEAHSVVIRVESAEKKLTGGLDELSRFVNPATCTDGELVRFLFMDAGDGKEFIKEIQARGLQYVVDGKAVDFIYVDQLRGIPVMCDWAEFGYSYAADPSQRIAVCWMLGKETDQIAIPPGWKYEHSLSRSFGFVPTEHMNRTLKFLRREGPMDVYLDLFSGKEMFVARTGKQR